MSLSVDAMKPLQLQGNNDIITDMKRADYPVKLTTLHDDHDDQFRQFTPSERVAMVWPLTVETYSLNGTYDTESRLQRHVVRLFRPQR